MESPIKYAIKINQRVLCFSWATPSHLTMAQNTKAVKRDDMAYTSPSTAENQNESEKVKARAPTSPLPITAYKPAFVNSPERRANFLAKAVIVQKRKRMVKELQSDDMTFTIIAEFSGEEKIVKKRVIMRKSGAPGGWGTCNLYAVAINSPQSQKLVVGSILDIYTNVAMSQVSQPNERFNFLKLSMENANNG